MYLNTVVTIKIINILHCKDLYFNMVDLGYDKFSLVFKDAGRILVLRSRILLSFHFEVLLIISASSKFSLKKITGIYRHDTMGRIL